MGMEQGSNAEWRERRHARLRELAARLGQVIACDTEGRLGVEYLAPWERGHGLPYLSARLTRALVSRGEGEEALREITRYEALPLGAAATLADRQELQWLPAR